MIVCEMEAVWSGGSLSRAFGGGKDSHPYLYLIIRVSGVSHLFFPIHTDTTEETYNSSIEFPLTKVNKYINKHNMLASTKLVQRIS